ncbi:uncharacterized protein V2V93DRAFT_370043, partial [Kockiozyma suomiensis]|uniref:uncharacterized protein n=1 Tax=Kockiozyma suomiensis TaxID=1337062 RepID=UPI003343F61B
MYCWIFQSSLFQRTIIFYLIHLLSALAPRRVFSLIPLTQLSRHKPHFDHYIQMYIFWSMYIHYYKPSKPTSQKREICKDICACHLTISP